MVIIMLGAPGTGKGSISQILKDELKITHVASGDMFRKYSSEDSDLGREINSYLTTGRLVPDEVTIKMIHERLEEPDVKDGVILDGFPRTEAQAKALDEMLSSEGKQVDLVVDLDSPKEEILERIVNRRICRDCKTVYNTKLNRKNVILQDGDVISIDLVVLKNGFNGDAARTYIVGKPNNEEDVRLVEVTEKTGMLAQQAAKLLVEKLK